MQLVYKIYEFMFVSTSLNAGDFVNRVDRWHRLNKSRLVQLHHRYSAVASSAPGIVAPVEFVFAGAAL